MRVNNMSIQVNKLGTGKFHAIDKHSLLTDLGETFSRDWNITTQSRDCSHLKAVREGFGGVGERSRITLTSKTDLTSGYGGLRLRIAITDQSFSGKALVITFGVYRLVCSNGLMGLRAFSTPIRVPHYANRVQLMQRLTEVITLKLAESQEVLAEIEAMNKAMVVNPYQAVETLGLPTNVVKEVQAALATGSHRTEDNPNTVWGLYNLVNEMDRRNARRNSTAYLARDAELVSRLVAA